MRANYSTSNTGLRAAARRGFSLAETVVAMAVVTVMSVVGLTACLLAVKIQNAAVGTQAVYNVCNEFVSAFYLACGDVQGADVEVAEFEDSFNSRIAFAVGCTAKKTSENGGDDIYFIYTESADGSLTYEYFPSGMTVSATVTFDGGAPFRISVTGRADGVNGNVYFKTCSADRREAEQ